MVIVVMLVATQPPKLHLPAIVDGRAVADENSIATKTNLFKTEK